MAKTLVGLDIGSTAVRAAEVSTGDVPVLARAAQVPLPSGAVENGEVRQPQVVGEALRELWGRSRIRGRQVRIGVGNQRVVVREIALPWLPDKELRASLGFQVQEFIPISGDDAVVDVGAHVTNISVHDRGIARFVRILPTGGRDITLAIARALGVDDDVAERLKRGEDVEGGPASEEVERVSLSRAGTLVDEIRSSLEFYTAQVPGARIGRVLITGGGSKLRGFLELVQERIPVRVDRGRVFERVKSELDLPPEAMEDAEPVLAVAVGLAIPGR